jgi:hypothetical protein
LQPRYSSKLPFDAYSTSVYPSNSQKHQHLRSYICYQHNENNQVAEDINGALPGKIEQNLINQQCSLHQSSNELVSRLCLRHSSTILPAPPGWSIHETVHNSDDQMSFQKLSIKNHAKNCIKESKDFFDIYNKKPSSKLILNKLVLDSGKNCEFICGNNKRKDTVSNEISSKRSGKVESITCSKIVDSRFKTEAVIEVNQKRPFSIESTKSAPDVIATH